MFVQVRCPQWVSSVIFPVPQGEMVEMAIDIQMVLLVMVDIMLIDMAMDVVVPMAPQVVVMVVLQMIFIELGWTTPLHKLEDDMDMTKVLNNMINLSIVWLLWTIHLSTCCNVSKHAKLFHMCIKSYSSITQRSCKWFLDWWHAYIWWEAWVIFWLDFETWKHRCSY